MTTETETLKKILELRNSTEANGKPKQRPLVGKLTTTIRGTGYKSSIYLHHDETTGTTWEIWKRETDDGSGRDDCLWACVRVDGSAPFRSAEDYEYDVQDEWFTKREALEALDYYLANRVHFLTAPSRV